MNNLWGLLTPENAEYTLFGVFGIVIVMFLIMDLGIFSRKAKKMTFKSALIQSFIWVSVAVGYGALIWYFGKDNVVSDPVLAAQELDSRDFLDFLTAYLTEYSLSVDNIFVFIVILGYFKIDEKYHHKVLYYGVFGAIIFRAIFIFSTSAIVSTSWGHYLLYAFGAILLFTGFKMLLSKGDDDFNPEKSRFYRILKRNLRLTNEDSMGRLTTRINGKLHFTILFLVIALIETTDIIFALDSIPAVFSITQDKFVIYTSNIFAVMGLRAMFFMLEGLIHRFHLLQKGISLVLLFIGAKMLLELVHEFLPQFHLEIPHYVSFLVILGVLIGSVLLSLVFPKKEKKA
jgi:tellurite resistance protein TerC